ncbi:MAG: response regulator transcription factor [Chloroflexi bacterium]|nr:response regulator transcription factor [Chloroflexota bacterium]MCX6001341.1 response regulator transcription factor [Chloroflexota bacterium]
MKVLIADGSSLIRNRLVDSLNGDKDIEIIGQAKNAIETIAEVWKLNPDAVVMDIQMPAGSGTEVLQSIKKHKPSTCVIILTSSDDPVYREKCLALGAHSFLDKATEFYRVAEILKGL